MNPIKKALWTIETHLRAELSLDTVARVAGVSKFHMARMFALVTGMPMMSYVRRRRLSEAARALAAGAPDILAVALESGYGSHEAFTRAFRDQFGMTPDALRALGHLNTITLTEAILIDDIPSMELAEPVPETLGELRFAGLGQYFGANERGGIPALWQRFAPSIGRVPGQAPGYTAYGVVYDAASDGSMHYLCAVALEQGAPAPEGFDALTVPAHHYLRFTHSGHVSGLSATFMAIFGRWLPASTYVTDEAPLLERYTERFDARTGRGDIDILVPVKYAGAGASGA
ncbi:MAG: GyrI-like domain-containing protein [Gammaproteobacteria bacterium]